MRFPLGLLAVFVIGITFAEGAFSQPALPAGLGGPALQNSPTSQPTFPALPSGLETLEAKDILDKEEDWADDTLTVSGFWEARLGYRLRDDATQKPFSIAETRLQTQLDKDWEQVTGRLTADVLYDPVREEHALDIEDGRGWLDLREANLLFRPQDDMDVKVGRQILTWGTGDLLFINDLFPKDWNSFFIGRDDEYLKAPSDAVKTAWFSDVVNVDFIYTPRFDADRYIDGQRLSYYNGNTGLLAGRSAPVRPVQRNEWFDEDEFALRLYRKFGAYEVAGYGYSGYWKSPAGQTAIGSTTQAISPALNVYGASVRGPLWQGIANAEVGYYLSRDDAKGTNGSIDNSQLRALVGYEQEVLPNLTGSVQYYIEHMRHHGQYLASLPAGAARKDEDRHLITLRLTKLAYQQNLKLSLFNFYSPTDQDGHTRLRANYKLDDNWQIESGANLFYSSQRSSFFGGFQDDANVFVGLRYGF